MSENRERLNSIDWLRGIVMVLMALDHVRDYFGNMLVDPTSLANPNASASLFFTRWLTHFCAPTFVFLAGAGAFLYGTRGRTKAQLARFLLTRGLWLLLLEYTVIYFGWTNSFSVGIWFLQVITAIGFGMIVLAGLVFLPTPAIAGIGLAIALGHNAFDSVTPDDLGAASWIWVLAHEGYFGFWPVGDTGEYLMVIYPLLPWVGVIAAGYAFGALLQSSQTQRRFLFAGLGVALILAFVLVRLNGGYGNPTPFAEQDTNAMTVASFLNCTKYPPSLAYLLMTLGPAILALGLLDREPGKVGRVFITFGRVPLFYYVIHLYVISLGARLFHKVAYGDWFNPMADGIGGFFTQPPTPWPEWYGHDLWVVYLAWIAVVAVTYPLCAWYAKFKASRESRFWRGVLSYL